MEGWIALEEATLQTDVSALAEKFLMIDELIDVLLIKNESWQEICGRPADKPFIIYAASFIITDPTLIKINIM